MKTHDIELALSKRYTAPQWAFMTQVRNATGYNRVTRTADALAMSLWPSRGLHMHGFEIKVSRHDWLRELKNPEKAEEIAQFCHFWWVVAPYGVVPIDEVPDNWGLITVKSGKLKTEKQAVFTQAKDMTWPMLASIFRNISTTMTPIATVDELVSERVDEVRQRISDENDRENRYSREALEKYREFERIAGIRVTEWDMGNIAQAVKAVRNGDDYTRRLRALKRDADAIADSLGRVLDPQSP